MYKIANVSIHGFWGDLTAECEFNDDINVIIGRNGTGKTTFMNILQAVLSVDTEQLAENEFEEVEISLIDGRKKKRIWARRQITNAGSQRIEYQISSKKFAVRIFERDDPRFLRMSNRRMHEETEVLRSELSQLVALSSLSVYRMRSAEDMEVQDKRGRRILSPVDYRLRQQMNELTRYQLELSRKVAGVSRELQKDVLGSILYERRDERGVPIPDRKTFDEITEIENLTNAYQRLEVFDSNIDKKIRKHVEAVNKAVQALADYLPKTNDEPQELDIDFAAVEAYQRTKRIVEMSLESESRSNEMTKHLNLLIDIIHEFIEDKTFNLEGGGLEITGSRQNTLTVERLSSGEKQLLILLTETLMQRERPYVFLADEPELSLHIAWQRKIIPSIKRLNPNAQVIVATHSPEIAGEHQSSIVDMQQIVK
jgi:ABC-type lipoprotein export system ATPase subunit